MSGKILRAAGLLVAGSRLGPYEILELIGSGGMGEVYRARDERLKREVAVKVLPASFADDRKRLQRFEQEARAAGGLNHPNVTAVYDVGAEGSRPYIVAELLHGQTLRARLSRGPLPVRKALEYAIQIAQGLAAAHEKGIVHRDLKPENVFVTKDDQVKILDFGLAKLTQQDKSGGDSATISETGTVLGTLGYMAPEQVLGDPADRRSDVFSFGAVLYEMLLGVAAFRGILRAEILNRILQEDPPELYKPDPRVPPGLMRILARCLEKEPAHRFESIKDVGFALNAYAQSSEDSGAALGPVATTGGGRQALLRWLALAAALAAGVGIAAFALRKPPEEPPRYHRLTFRRGEVTGARFAPDGEVIVYGACWEGMPKQLFSTRADSTESMPLPLPEARLLSISRSGTMAIELGPFGLFTTQTLAEVALAGGAPREIIQGNDLRADWSPDNRNLAVLRHDPEHNTLEFPLGKAILEAQGLDAVRFAPGGDAIAVVESQAAAEYSKQILLVDRGGRKSTLTKGWNLVVGLAWHPTTGELWFSARESGRGRLSVHAVSPSGRHRVVARGPGDLVIHDISRDGHVLLTRDETLSSLMYLSPGETKEVDLSWLDVSKCFGLSEDGKTVLFGEAGEVNGEAGGIYLRKTDGSPAIRLGEGLEGALSPDGKWAATIPVERDRLVLLPTGAGDPKVLRQEGLRYKSAQFFPDGRRILFVASVPDHLDRIYVQEVAGGTARPLTPDGYWFDPAGAVSPDGKWILSWMWPTGPQDMKRVLYPVERGDPVVLSGLTADDQPIRWDATGKAIFVAKGDERVQLYRYELATGRREFVRGIASSPRLDLCLRLTPDGRSYAYNNPRTFSTLFVVEGLK